MAVVASFTATPTDGSPTIAFTDTSTGSPTSWLWAFGDGETSTAQNPTHTYATTGDYTVTLTASRGAIGSEVNLAVTQGTPTAHDTSNHTGDRHWAETHDQYANDNNYATSAFVNGGVTNFTCYLKTDLTEQCDITSFNLKGNSACFVGIEGSNNGSTWTNIPITLTSGSWTAPAPGATYTPTSSPASYRYFRIKSQWPGAGSSATNVEEWRINGRPTDDGPSSDDFSDDFSVTSVLNFEGTPTTGLSPLSVVFTNVSDNLGDTAGYLWDFGDGTTSTEESPTHVYQPGVYDVTLTVDFGGDEWTLTKTAYITVISRPILPRERDQILLSIRASFNDENLYNHALVIATGDKASIKYGEASDTDPSSPTRIEVLGDRVIKLETDLITTQATANKAAKKLFLDNCLVSEDIALEAICNPALEGNDVIGVQELTFSQIERNFRVQSFTVPLSSSRQNLKLARVIDLQTQTISINDDIILVGYEQTIKTTASTSAVVNVPVATTDGDFMLLWVAFDGTNLADVNPAASGFSSLIGSNKWKRKWAESEGSTKTVTWSGARRAIVTLMVYRNVDPTNPVAKLVSGNDTGKTVTIPGMTLPSAEYHLVAGVQADGVTSYEWPETYWTEMVESDTGGTGNAHLAVSIADRPRVGANPPYLNVMASDNLYNTVYQIALRKDVS
jgi:PKD repeat protein